MARHIKTAHIAELISLDQLADRIPKHHGLTYMVELDDSDNPFEVYVTSLPLAVFKRDGVLQGLHDLVREQLGHSLAVFVTE